MTESETRETILDEFLKMLKEVVEKSKELNGRNPTMREIALSTQQDTETIRYLIESSIRSRHKEFLEIMGEGGEGDPQTNGKNVPETP